jgi:hypothetical protein
MKVQIHLTENEIYQAIEQYISNIGYTNPRGVLVELQVVQGEPEYKASVFVDTL